MRLAVTQSALYTSLKQIPQGSFFKSPVLSKSTRQCSVKTIREFSTLFSYFRCLQASKRRKYKKSTQLCKPIAFSAGNRQQRCHPRSIQTFTGRGVGLASVRCNNSRQAFWFLFLLQNTHTHWLCTQITPRWLKEEISTTKLKKKRVKQLQNQFSRTRKERVAGNWCVFYVVKERKSERECSKRERRESVVTERTRKMLPRIQKFCSYVVDADWAEAASVNVSRAEQSNFNSC